MRARLFLIAVLALGIVPASAAAQAYGEAVEDPDTRDQINLVWIAGYQGPLNGRIGPRAREAIMRFQAAQGYARSGVLTDYQREELERLAVAEKRRLGWRMRTDPATGMRIGVAEALLDRAVREDDGTEYRGRGKSYLLKTMVLAADTPQALPTHLGIVSQVLRDRGFSVTYSTLKDDWYVINASNRSTGIDSYVRVHRVGSWIKGYILSTAATGLDMGGLVPATSLSLVPDAETPQYRPRPSPPPAVVQQAPPQASAAAAPPPAAPKAPERSVSSGSGFVVAPNKLVTNLHVAGDCDRLEVTGVGPARVLARDSKNDLALVEAPGLSGRPLAFAPEPARLGEDVVAMGYPLPDYLGGRINITQGIVSSTEGMGGDWTRLQISVPVQPGNSGGPLFDLEGRVQGVVVAQMRPTVSASGDVTIPQQVNFAIKNELVRGFLKGNAVAAVESASAGTASRKSTADIAETSRPSVVQLICTGKAR